MTNETNLNVLVSFARSYKSKKFNSTIKSAAADGKINLMIDSGAFTIFNSPKDTSHISVDSYCEYLAEMGPYAEKYVMLDVIGNAKDSRANYEKMVSKGLLPMYVATMFDTDYAYISSCLDINPNICVAGGATTKGKWMQKRFQDVFLYTGSKAKIHGLAYVTIPDMFRLPLASVDSSSWSSGKRFGTGFVYQRNGKRLTYNWADFVKHGKQLPTELIQAFEKSGITPAMFFNPQYHAGNKSIEFYLGLLCTIDY